MSMQEAYKFSMSRLRRLIIPFIRLLMPPAKPNIIYVFEDASLGNKYGIQSWATRINLAEAERCRVVSIDFRKANASKEHEFLFIRLWYPPSFETHIIAERCVVLGSESFSVLLMPLSSHSSPPTPASDTLKFADRPYEDTYSVKFWKFDNGWPSVADLCAVMYSVSILGPFYLAHDKQCFWFAGTVYGVLTKEFSGTETVGRNNGQTYMNLPVPTADIADAVHSIQRDYRSKWQEFIVASAPEREAHVEQARQQGREQGLAEGLAAGRAESAAQIAELQNLLGM